MADVKKANKECLLKTLKVMGWIGGFAAILGLGYLVGNEKARTKVITTAKNTFKKDNAVATETATEETSTAVETTAQTETTSEARKTYNNGGYQQKKAWNNDRRQYNN